MRRLPVCTAFATVLMAALLGPAHGQSAQEEPHEAISAGNAAYIEALGSANAPAFANVYDARGSRLAGGGEIVRGRGAIADYIGSFFTRIGPVEATIETADLWVIDELAYETGRWTYTFTPPGDNRRTIGGRYVNVWKQQESGGWKILVDMGVPGTEF